LKIGPAGWVIGTATVIGGCGGVTWILPGAPDAAVSAPIAEPVLDGSLVVDAAGTPVVDSSATVGSSIPDASPAAAPPDAGPPFDLPIAAVEFSPIRSSSKFKSEPEVVLHDPCRPPGCSRCTSDDDCQTTLAGWVCDTSMHRCVECMNPNDCPNAIATEKIFLGTYYKEIPDYGQASRWSCRSNECYLLCSSSAPICPVPLVVNGSATPLACVMGVCAECQQTADCTAAGGLPICAKSGRCVECEADSDCDGGKCNSLAQCVGTTPPFDASDSSSGSSASHP
jgi:hypothetical protein